MVSIMKILFALLDLIGLLVQSEGAIVSKITITSIGNVTDDLLVKPGNWTTDLTHEPAGGIFRVAGDGPKPEVQANPVSDIGTTVPITEDFITSHPNYAYLSPLSECGISGMPSIVGGQDKPTDDDVAVYNVNKLKFELSLGNILDDDKRKKRIVGGKHVEGSQMHPWMVQLYLLNIASGEHYFHCAGTLITNQTILTAAHCLTRIQPGTSLDVAVIGNNDRRKVKFCATSDPLENCSRNFTRAVEDVEVHYGYSEGNLNHDIGLIYLKRPVKVSASVRPICLPYSSKLLENWKNIKLTALGWGSTSKFTEGYNSDFLKQVELDLQARSLCDKFHIRIYGRTTEDRICTGGNTGRGTCNGDSGGGIVKSLPVTRLGGSERVFQLGIVSAGGHVTDTCGFQGRPTIDTNILYYMEWILNHVAPGVASYTYEQSKKLWIDYRTKDGQKKKVSFANDGDNYKNEFSTGKKVDVSRHPNVGILPAFTQCGSLLTLKPEMTVKAQNNYDAAKRLKRIVGGVPTNLDNFLPWMAQIYVRNVETNEVALRCSGTIITPRHILTSAHCTTEIASPFVFDGVVVGQYNRNSTKECIDGTCYFPIVVKVSDVIIHGEYEKYTHKHNIALIRLQENLNFTRMVQPICLPRREVLTDGINVMRFFSAGWGRVLRESLNGPDGKLSEILLQIYVELLPRRDCNFVYSRAVDMLDRSRLCGGGKASRGECTGDGGSPLMKILETERTHALYNKVFQVGIVSFTDCGMEGMPTVYSNIIYYMKWILDNLENPDD